MRIAGLRHLGQVLPTGSGALNSLPTGSDAQMRAISAKTMVIVGDADAVQPEHAVAMFKLRGGGDEEASATGTLTKVPRARLVILPATSHIGIAGEVKVVESMVTPFLEDAPPANPVLRF